MQIYGLQKMTLLDYPGRVACTVFLSGCDMRCPWCHNSELAEGKAPPVMTVEALLAFLKGRKGLLDGVAVTGGEPLLREENLALLRQVREMGYDVKLDTNGTHPERLRRAVTEGLAQYVAMDIKNSPEKYAVTIGRDAFDLGPVRESVSFLKEGKTAYEFRTTVVRELHDEASFRGIGAWIDGAERYALQRFTDRDTVPYEGFHGPEDAEIEKWAQGMKSHVREVIIR